MSGFDDRPYDFVDWLAENVGDADWADEYVRRSLYGRYLESLLRHWAAGSGRPRLKHITAAAVNLV